MTPSRTCSAHKLVADVAVLAADQVLLVRYTDTANYDGQRGWFLPDDFLNHLEHPAAAARRIGSEQAGLSLADVALDHIESFGNGAWHLVFHFRAEIDGATPVKPSGNVADAQWFPLGGLPPRSELAHEGWTADVLDEIVRGRG